MAQNIKLIVYPAKNIEAAKALYTQFLATEPYVDSPFYVGYKVGNLEIGLDPKGQEVISYIDVDDIKSELQALVVVGATIHQEPTNVGGGLLVAKIKDQNGNVLGLRQASK
jgi:predicted enzyme related to lactoylglutathione lyase